jgi:putative transposase
VLKIVEATERDRKIVLTDAGTATENHILKSQIKGRLRLSDGERATLAGIAQRLGRKALQEIACIVKPDTILLWYRKLVAQKFDGAKKRGLAGRPRVDATNCSAGGETGAGKLLLGL